MLFMVLLNLGRCIGEGRQAGFELGWLDRRGPLVLDFGGDSVLTGNHNCESIFVLFESNNPRNVVGVLGFHVGEFSRQVARESQRKYLFFQLLQLLV